MQAQIKDMLSKGEDPKELVMESCQAECVFWSGKLGRCEEALKKMENADPEKTCLYPSRDYIMCIEACAQKQIQSQLKGQEKGFFS